MKGKPNAHWDLKEVGMKLLYSGASGCDDLTFKRLLLVGTELVFMDRPSVTFGNWGTVGHQSFLRNVDTTGEPVTVSVVAPPSGPAQALYEPYAVADVDNPDFARVVLEGIRDDQDFASKFIQPNAKYGDGLDGQTILETLSHYPDLRPLPLHSPRHPTRMFRVDTDIDRRSTLRTIVTEASIQVTSALVVAAKASEVPVANDPYLLKLLSLRTSAPKYVGDTAPHASLIGVEFVKAVIPDEALKLLSIPDLLAYRRSAADVYDAWTSELNQLAAMIDELNIAEAQDRIPKLLATVLRPKIVAYKAEMMSVRDKLFADLVKGIKNWKVPALSLASLATFGYGAAIAAFVSSVGASSLGPLVDYKTAKRAAERKHAISYLLRVSDA